MAEPFLSELKIWSQVYAPRGWAQCNGQLLPINQNQALFSLLGTTYGGNGQTTFALPDLRGRVPMHVGGGHTLGENGGEQAHTVSIAELPTHTHIMQGTAVQALLDAPAGAVLAQAPISGYGPPASLGTMAAGTVGNTGGSQAHLNMQPFLTLNICIALQGIFPSPN